MTRTNTGLNYFGLKFQDYQFLFQLLSINQVLQNNSYYHIPLYYIRTTHQAITCCILLITGSIVFYYLLATQDMSIAAPVSNSLTFVFTAITSTLVLGEKINNPLLLATGTYLLFVSHM